MIYINNLKDCFIQKTYSDDTVQNQEQNDNDNYDIIIKRNELKDLIFALNIIIEDLNNNQNKLYIISEIENVINKLIKADIPPKKDIKDINLIQTFSTVDLNETNNTSEKNNCNPNPIGLDENFIDDKTYCTDIVSNHSNEKYEGALINGKKEGKGIYIYQNGSKYEGYFKNDKKEGNGIFYYANGDRYKGNFHEGNFEGTTRTTFI